MARAPGRGIEFGRLAVRTPSESWEASQSGGADVQGVRDLAHLLNAAPQRLAQVEADI